MRQHQALFANFICKFGERNFLDLAEDIVIPALTDDSIVRTHGNSSYYILQPKLINFGSKRTPRLALRARFVKDTELTRQQYLQGGALVPSERKLQTSPSAFFVLYLADHKMVYFAETAHAPDISALESTIRFLVAQKRKKYIDQQHKELKGTEDQATKKQLAENLPYPKIDIVPLSNKASLSEFIDLFETLRRIEVIVLERNDEFDASELAEGINAYNASLGGDKTKLITVAKDGLDAEAAKESLAAIVSTGNQIVKISGDGVEGDNLAGTNTEFSIKTDLSNPSSDDSEKAKQLDKLARDHQESGLIPAANPPQTILDTLLRLMGRFGVE